MKKFEIHEGIITPINIMNIDTDIIIPKQFLKKTTKEGFGKNLFYNWRFLDKKKKINKKFILNKKKYKKSSILITGKNFGCGSSREHAVWALMDYGYRVIISSKFSDIFYNNSINNNLLLIKLSEKKIQEIISIIKKNKIYKCKINLISKKIILNKIKYNFKINKFYRFKLLKGLDKIDLTLKKIKKIINYEKKKIPEYLEKRKLFS
ncbi:MAG: 3-isopropylmalate dehydratase small subunit [Buchnera aphidicola (Periphyllus lyropictus)]|uniref:3-isopropylmalate dehydratase small subunit n=1 Tax=Buchnera aphidicola TaxID=9 RepID=UPI001ECEAB3A|nr:3-isopropylmalate dehydratase small subunit [Buchnera aphidicola]NIH16722.1 3-isopropylmalate dehydratase small subunit [Buchnera aphidicola (Periphyllus lyropictus)]USS94627.1 3-isopropylmalate dehydratase small subunit [Buchnera aphidicola (Periphyllus lyropictus)]